MNWTNHVVIVTGAGSGIGKGIAERFAEEGAEVVIAEVNAARGEAVAQELQARYGKGIFIRTNVAHATECQALIRQTVATYGHIDTLVNNAGVNFVKPTLEMDEADWDRVIDVDLKGTFLCSRYALAEMVPRKEGTIINIASVHTVATLPQAAPYAAAKGGVDMLTKALAIEFAPHGIRVNAVSPGLTDTQIWQDLQNAAADADAARQHWFDNIPLGRVQSPREVANVVLFLASAESSYITGANIMTDGGMTIQLINQARYASKALEGKMAGE
ncbi:MAG TPA: glucose 1-dehydrogenase [Caldilineaceae bacterium]|nr:glucose 1-dehydrogenase [Caldilineaceae bacterium]